MTGEPISSSALAAYGMYQLGTSLFSNYARATTAKQNRQFQERMSSTAHQREVADLRAAGLNPVLSAQGGRGASSPGGSQAQITDPLINLPETAIKKTQASTARQLADGQIKTLNTQALKNSADTINANADTALKQSQERTQQYLQATESSKERLNSANALQVESGIPKRKLEKTIYDSVNQKIIPNLRALPEYIESKGQYFKNTKRLWKARKKLWKAKLKRKWKNIKKRKK